MLEQINKCFFASTTAKLCMYIFWHFLARAHRTDTRLGTYIIIKSLASESSSLKNHQKRQKKWQIMKKSNVSFLFTGEGFSNDYCDTNITIIFGNDYQCITETCTDTFIQCKTERIAKTVMVKNTGT